MPTISERCQCGAEFEYSTGEYGNPPEGVHREWIERHSVVCPFIGAVSKETEMVDTLNTRP